MVFNPFVYIFTALEGCEHSMLYLPSDMPVIRSISALRGNPMQILENGTQKMG